MERAVEMLLFWSRWLLVPIYLGLASLLLLLGFVFMRELWHLALVVGTMGENDVILAALTLVDLALVASLVVMMVLSGYENFVSRIDVADGVDRPTWLGKLDATGLKVKLGASLVAISSIHLLKSFMNIETASNEKLFWLVVIHLTFVVSTLLMALIDRVTPPKPGKD
jgi:uncharacterized protein (TIGR00645 family)